MSDDVENELVDDLSTVQFSENNDEELTFFTSIDDATKEWLNSLEHIWSSWKKCDGVCKTLTDYFDSAPNPYLSTLRILVNTSDFKHIKSNSSLAKTVIEEFMKWLEPRKDTYKEFLALDLKLATFRLIIKQNNMEFIKMVTTTYELIEHKEEFIDVIKQTIDKKKYKEAAHYTIMLQLQEHFSDPECLLLPLILQNKYLCVEDFLAGYPELQKSIVLYLDNLIGPNNNIQQVLNNIIQKNKIPEIKIHTMQTKPLKKLIARFVKLYNIPPECCPNLNKIRCEGALHFLIHKRYVDCSLSAASWREMVEEAVGNDKTLQLDMIRMLVNAKDATEALYWARKFDIPKDQWPWAVTYEEERLEGINKGASTSKMNDWEENEEFMNYHELKLSRQCIKVVNNSHSFEEFLDTGLKDVSIVGIDSEWKPCFGTKQTELALIQIATKTNVYIIDVTTIGNQLDDLWVELVSTLFENKSILKLGFGIAQDMTVLRSSLSALSKVKTCGEGYIDIVHLWRKLVDDYKFVFPHESNEHFAKNSLSKLVELCLGQKLNKSDQFSNWEQRPLRESQIIYAALDAYCLLEIYETLENQCQHLDIPFFDVCMEVQHIRQQSPKKNIRKPQKKPYVIKFEGENNGGQQNFQRNPVSEKFRNVWKPRFQNKHSFNKLTQPTVPVRPIRLSQQNRCVNTTKRVEHANYKSNDQEQRQQIMKHKYVPMNKWRVVCDFTLGGLASKLRLCGCNCIHLALDQGGEQSAKIAMLENRVLLTRNKGYLKFVKYIPAEECYLVMADTPEAQLREVLTYFRIVITERDIFSRCQVCNSNEFAKVPKLLMDKLITSYVRLTRQSNYRVVLNGCNIDETKGLRQNDFVQNNMQREDRTWLLSTNSVNIQMCTTKYGTRIHIEKVPIIVLRNVQLFYVCELCGKIYWSGSHLERTLNDVIKDLIVPV
ncbi:exonuclease mut-7 homolog isoform X1 [Xylocopa sonorina]|uniref:exonuclease mut-7 homolog isoform X1 n=1 Tax=Xylocopa sonorina TaxID=1818115 RepID=UPI00403B10DA